MKRKTRKRPRRKSRKSSVRRTRKHYFKRPTTARQYFSMSQKEQETWDSVAHVITRMRHRVSLAKASKEFGVEPSVVITLGRQALRKKKWRYVPTKTDRLLRVLPILGIKGKKQIATRDSRQASVIGGHWAAVQRYLRTGDDSALLKFKKRRVIDVKGKRHRLQTNLEKLDRLASAGVLSFESMYAGGLR